MSRFQDIAFTPAVKGLQTAHGSRSAYARFEGRSGTDTIGPDERAFIETRDSFYVASISQTGWPYIQHRGGPAGFLKVIDAHTLAFADYRGNKQYISAGNVSTNDRVALFLMDYPQQARLKLLGHMSLSEDAAVKALVTPVNSKTVIERVFVIAIEGFDWNCPQYITPRFTEAELRPMLAPLQEKLTRLERENAELRRRVK